MPGLTGLSAIQPIPFGGGAGAGACTYLLLYPADGADDQGFANGQILDTEAEGAAVGSLVVTENDGTLSLVSDWCHFTAQATPTFGDLALHEPNGIAKALGTTLFETIAYSTRPVGAMFSHLLGWANTLPVTGGGDREYYVYLTNTTDLTTGPGGGAAGGGVIFDGWAAETEYKIAMVLGGYTSFKQPWFSGGAGTFLYGGAVFIKGGIFSEWSILWRWALQDTATLYPFFTSRAGVGDLQYFRVPDHDYSPVLQPTVADWFAGLNGTSLDAHTPSVGTGWSERVGDWELQGGEAVLVAQTDRGYAILVTGVADAWGRDTLESNTADSTTAGDAGLVYRRQDDDNYWYAGINDAANAFRIVERVGGVETVRATAAVAIGTGTKYEVTITTLGNEHQAWLNGGSRLTWTSALLATATGCGIRSKETADAHDNFHVQPASGYTELDECPGYAVGASGDWWDPDDEGLCIWGAWDAEDAASYAASLLDLSGNGHTLVEDLGAVPWTPGVGWNFTAALTQCLRTGFVPAADQSQTIIVQYANFVTVGTYVAGMNDAGIGAFELSPNVDGTNLEYANGGTRTVAPTLASGNMAVAGSQGYRDGVAEGAAIAAWTPGAGSDVYIGARNNGGVPAGWSTVDVRKVGLYGCTLTAGQVAMIVGRMEV